MGTFGTIRIGPVTLQRYGGDIANYVYQVNNQAPIQLPGDVALDLYRCLRVAIEAEYN
jgi:hypothetical protein